MEVRTEEKEIRDWYCNFITLFRKNYASLSEFEKTGIDLSINLLEPCQIEIFWLKNPELQLIILTHIPERSDMEVIVHGPFDGREFYEKVETILSEERWQKKVGDEDFFDPYLSNETLAESLAKEFNQMREYAKFILFHPYDVGDTGGGGTIDENIWVEIHVGNISKADYKTKLERVMTQIKSGAKARAEMLSKVPGLIKDRFELKEPFKYSAVQIQKEGGYGFGVHLFPPVILGKMARPTIRQLLEGVRTDTTIFNRSFELEIDKKLVIVNRDGYIFIEISKKEEALKILNLIMALGTLRGPPLFAVREQDLSTASYDKNHELVSKQWNTQTLRSQLHENSSMFDYSLSHERTEITKEELTSLIKDAFTILKDNELSDDLKLFVEAFTHYRNTEYSQSFVMSWSIIERHYSSLWKNMLDEKKVDKQRLRKTWSIDYVIEALDRTKKINEEDYNLLMELKKERNKFYHGGHQMPKEDAVKCLKLARKIITNKLSSFADLN